MQKIAEAYQILNGFANIIEEMEKVKGISGSNFYYSSEEEYREHAISSSKYVLDGDPNQNLINKFRYYLNFYYKEIDNAIDLIVLDGEYACSLRRELEALYQHKFTDEINYQRSEENIQVDRPTADEPAPGGSDFYRQILRMRPDILSVPEVNTKTIASYNVLVEALSNGHTLLGTFHSVDPYTVLDRFYTQWEEYFTGLEGEVSDEMLSLREKRNICEHLSMVVDVSRVVVNNKSLILASRYDVTPALVDAWLEGSLREYLDSEGFVPAGNKKTTLLKSLEN